MTAKEINQLFSDFIRTMMENKRINQSELARQTGVSQERISRIVNNESRISLQDFVIITSALDIDFVREFLKKYGKEDILCRLSYRKIVHPLIVPVQQMQYLTEYDSCSHLLLQTPSYPQNWKGLITASIRKLAECLPDIRQLDGVWRSFTIARHYIRNSQNLSMQRELAEAHCAEGSC